MFGACNLKILTEINYSLANNYQDKAVIFLIDHLMNKIKATSKNILTLY